ncbi:MAG: hypothetical protein JJ850_17270 [Kordiimonadaceae bacterium]|nr:hypothetical protein [Kordiimonadaceae bacterium]MBO6570505.1 hypothetical protein [Kordiimonadaceae bacterium]MBO6966376.1 hypothetical protein [Kordiimonadaceae bacterium]
MTVEQSYIYYALAFFVGAIAFYSYTEIASRFTRAVLPNEDKDRESGIFRIVLFCFVLCVAAVLLWFQFRLGYQISRDMGDWGSFGDFFGGLMNPIISLAILYFVLQAYLTQREELSKTVAALEKSNSEQATQTIINSLSAEMSGQNALLDTITQEDAYLNERINALEVHSDFSIPINDPIYGQQSPSSLVKIIRKRQQTLDNERKQVKKALEQALYSLEYFTGDLVRTSFTSAELGAMLKYMPSASDILEKHNTTSG